MVVSKIFGTCNSICLKILEIREPNSGNPEDQPPDVLGTDEPEEGRSETKFSTKGERKPPKKMSHIQKQFWLQEQETSCNGVNPF